MEEMSPILVSQFDFKNDTSSSKKKKLKDKLIFNSENVMASKVSIKT